MLSFTDFSNKIITDLNKRFSEVIMEGNHLVVKFGPTSMSIPFNTMYKEYQSRKDYMETLKSYSRIFNDILSQYKFKIDYKNVYPMLKSRDFRQRENNIQFYREQAFADIDTLYVTDAGEVFRFVLNSDDVDFEKVRKRAWENLNKITNPLVKLDKMLDIFCLKYSTDYNSTLLLSTTLQKQIYKKVGQEYLFAIPSSTTLIVAKLRPEYIKIIESLIMIDNDPNKVSNKVYQHKDGKFDIASV